MEIEDASILHFHEAFFAESPTTINISSFLAESPIIHPAEDPSSFPDPQPGLELDYDDDPLSDPVIWQLCKETEISPFGNSIVGPSGFAGEDSGEGINEISDFGDEVLPLPLSLFSVTPSNPNCSCCQKLRVIIHNNGMNMKRLQIHGRLGIITHVVLEKYDFNSSFEGQEFQMFDFKKKSTSSVKVFLLQYIETCKQEGYNMLPDPLLTFYEALCVGLKEDDFIRFSVENPGDCHNNSQTEVGSNEMEVTKIPLAIQRERTGKMELKDFIHLFELPIDKAARKMRICPTVMKKICRKNGMVRWPYRKIKCIKNKLYLKYEILNGGANEEEKARAMVDIQGLEQKLGSIYMQFTPQ